MPQEEALEEALEEPIEAPVIEAMRNVVLKGTMKMMSIMIDLLMKEDRVAVGNVLLITQAKRNLIEDQELLDLNNSPEEI